MKATKGQFMKRSLFSAEHLGGKKFTQFGAGHIHKEKEVRRHRTGGPPYGQHRPMG